MRNRINWKALLAVCLLLVCISAFVICHNKHLTVSTYELPTELPNRIRIVQLTDLHQKQFGDKNVELISMIRLQNPDLIVMTGDMQNRDDPNAEVVLNLVSELSEIADVYFSFGNHEASWVGTDLREKLANAGAIVVDNNYYDVQINGNDLRVGGYMGFFGAYHMTAHAEEAKLADEQFAADFMNTERYTILLDHIPTSWVDWGYINKYPVDLVFCGHYHGGVVRLPIIDQGLYAPYVGWFPPYTKGLYEGENASCVLSAGLGSEYIVPRLNNPPEIVVVDLIPKE